MGTPTWIVSFEFTVISHKADQFVHHGPDNDDAHSTVAAHPGSRLLHTSTPFWLKLVMIGFCARVE